MIAKIRVNSLIFGFHMTYIVVFNYVLSKNSNLLSLLFDLHEHALNRIVVQRIFQLDRNSKSEILFYSGAKDFFT